MNDHPDELLAEYVDGDLSPEQRARVDEHVSGCARCSDEVVQARLARAALSSLEEEAPPPGIPLAVRRRAHPRSTVPWRAAGIAAVAAATIAGAVIVLTDQEGPPERAAAPAAGGAEEAGSPPAPARDETAETTGQAGFAAPSIVPTYSESNTDYEPATLALLGRRLRGQADAALDAGLPDNATAFYEDFDPGAFTTEVREALRCATDELPPDQLVVPFTIEAARFQGEPVYVAAFLQGPSPDEPYDRIVVWVVDRETCTLRSLASQRL